jgi:hypothetical protein
VALQERGSDVEDIRGERREVDKPRNHLDFSHGHQAAYIGDEDMKKERAAQGAGPHSDAKRGVTLDIFN